MSNTRQRFGWRNVSFLLIAAGCATGCEGLRSSITTKFSSISPNPPGDASVGASPTPSPSPSSTPSPIPAPSVVPPVSVNEKITDIKIYATSSSAAQTNVPVTFGIPFPKGALKSGMSAVLRNPSNQSLIPTQFEIKAKHDDGSARHAIVTAIVPQIAASSTLSLDLVAAQSSQQSSVDISSLFNNGFSASVSVTVNGTIYQANLNASDYKSVQIGTWLQGPLATEGLFKVPLVSGGQSHPLLHARFYVRAYQGGTAARVGVAIENTGSYGITPGNVTYDLQVQVGGQTVLSQSALPHYAHSRWYRNFFYGKAPIATVGLNPQFLLTSPAVPHYDPTLKIPDSVITNWYNRWNTTSGLMDVGPVQHYMPTTGGRPDIGPLPAWNAVHVLTQDPRAFEVATGIGYQAGTWSIHYRDPDTDLPLSIDRYPYATLVGNSGDTLNPVTKKKEEFPACTNCTTPFVADTSHQPSMAYYPYLITGDYYLLEEQMFWAAMILFEPNPYYRNFADGLIKSDQLRGQGWSMRTLAQSAYILPDDHPYKSFFTDKVQKNIAWYDQTYVQNTNNVLGIITNGYSVTYNNNTGMAPWMQAFFTWSIGNAYNMGFTSAKNLLMFLSKYQVGIMTDPEFCWISASAYTMTVRTTSTSPFFTTFGEVYRATVDPKVASLPCASQEMATQLGLKQGEMMGYAAETAGYPSNLQPALAVLVDGAAPNAAAAWNLFISRPVKPNYTQEPVWAIVPVVSPSN